MTYKDREVNREHNRLSQQIRRGKAKGQDISQLIAQREALSVRPPKKSDNLTTKQTGKISNQAVSEILAKIKQLREEQKELRTELASGKVNYWPIIKKTPKGKKFIFYVYE